jgi:hypothetical protein
MALVICIDNKNYPISLELNKEYQAKESENFYIIIDSNLEDNYFPKNIFEKVKD